MVRSIRATKPRRTRVLSKRVKQRTRGKARPRRTAQKKRKSLRGGMRKKKQNNQGSLLGSINHSLSRAVGVDVDDQGRPVGIMGGAASTGAAPPSLDMVGPTVPDRPSQASVSVAEGPAEVTEEPDIQKQKISHANFRSYIALITFLKFLTIVYDERAMKNILESMSSKIKVGSTRNADAAKAIIIIAAHSLAIAGAAGLGGVPLHAAPWKSGLAAFASSSLVPTLGEKWKSNKGKHISYKKLGPAIASGKWSHIIRRRVADEADTDMFRKDLVQFFFGLYPYLTHPDNKEKLAVFDTCVKAFQGEEAEHDDGLAVAAVDSPQQQPEPEAD